MFQKLTTRIQKADLEQPIRLTLKNNTRLVLWFNTIAQLYNKGVDVFGKKFAGYSSYTIAIKKAKGQPVDRVTLKDTGKMYASAQLEVGEHEASIHMSREDNGEDVVEKLKYHFGEFEGLTPESKSKLLKMIKPEIIKHFRESIL